MRLKGRHGQKKRSGHSSNDRLIDIYRASKALPVLLAAGRPALNARRPMTARRSEMPILRRTDACRRIFAVETWRRRRGAAGAGNRFWPAPVRDVRASEPDQSNSATRHRSAERRAVHSVTSPLKPTHPHYTNRDRARSAPAGICPPPRSLDVLLLLLL